LQAKIQELEMKNFSLSGDLVKTASLYKDCFACLQKVEAQYVRLLSTAMFCSQASFNHNVPFTTLPPLVNLTPGCLLSESKHSSFESCTSSPNKMSSFQA
jgi:hypothetical protein